MKRKRKLLILALSLVLVSGAALLVRFLSPEEETGETAETVFAQSSDEVTELSFTYEGETLRFQKENDTWTYPDDSHFSVNASSIETMLASLEKVESSKPLKTCRIFQNMGWTLRSARLRLRQVTPAFCLLVMKPAWAASSTCRLATALCIWSVPT